MPEFLSTLADVLTEMQGAQMLTSDQPSLPQLQAIASSGMRWSPGRNLDRTDHQILKASVEGMVEEYRLRFNRQASVAEVLSCFEYVLGYKPGEFLDVGNDSIIAINPSPYELG